MSADLSRMSRDQLNQLIRDASEARKRTKASALFPVGNPASVTADGRQGIVCISGNVNVWLVFPDKTSAMFKVHELSAYATAPSPQISEAQALQLADRQTASYREKLINEGSSSSPAPMRKRAPTIHQE